MLAHDFTNCKFWPHCVSEFDTPTQPGVFPTDTLQCDPLTVRCVPCGWRCVLEYDRHEGLADGALPRLGHLPPHAAIRSHLAGRGRGRRESRGDGRGHWGQIVGILPDKIAHFAGNELEAVGVRARGDQREVPGRAHLKDLGQGDLLQRGSTGGEAPDRRFLMMIQGRLCSAWSK